MSTNGAVGFRIDGIDKIAYNHFDSYPDGGLGEEVVEFIRGWLALGRDEMRAQARALRVINEPVEENEEGDLAGYLAAGVIPDCAWFLADSLFCAWAYVINLDDFTFEVYRGYQPQPHTNGRYSTLPPRDRERREKSGTVYYPVALVGTFPLEDIPQTWIAQVDPDEEEDAEK